MAANSDSYLLKHLICKIWPYVTSTCGKIIAACVIFRFVTIELEKNCNFLWFFFTKILINAVKITTTSSKMAKWEIILV